MEEQKIPGIKLGKNKNTIRFFAFADDIAILTENLEHAKIVLENLHETAQKAGLKISYAKTEYFDPKNRLRHQN